MRFGIRALCALGVAAAAATTALASGPTITANSIRGVKLGLSAASVEKLLGKPYSAQQAAGGDLSLPGFQQPESDRRVVFPRLKMDVYFKQGSDRAIEITTWNKSFRTAAGIGPCSTVAQLKKAYGKRLKPSPHATQNGNVTVYLVGSLLFADEDLEHVTAVGLAKPHTSHELDGEAAFVIQPPDQISCS
jgi:hypothetical protein